MTKQVTVPIRVPIDIEPDGNGFDAHCPLLKDLYVVGETEEEALRNAGDAAAGYIATLLKRSELVLDPVEHLRHDMRDAAVTLSPREARYLVDYYYLLQESRKGADNRLLSMAEEPHRILSWVAENTRRLENSVKRALAVYSQSKVVGRWAESNVGIGPVISAGLLGHIDIEEASTAGHIWNFAGLNPGIEWLGKEKATKLVAAIVPPRRPVTTSHIQEIARQAGRHYGTILGHATKEDGKITRESLIKAVAERPWNADLKTLCWKIGECFKNVCNKPDSYYGGLYRERKLWEESQNEQGLYANQARKKLETVRIGRDTEAYKHYSAGRLPPAHILMRAKRWTVKIFLSHWHQVCFEDTYGYPPPVPYAIAYLGHAHLLKVPNWPME